jgi:hypothetical protein
LTCNRDVTIHLFDVVATSALSPNLAHQHRIQFADLPKNRLMRQNSIEYTLADHAKSPLDQ